MRVVYEDQLPADMTDSEYEWFSRSWVDGVRVGPCPEGRDSAASGFYLETVAGGSS